MPITPFSMGIMAARLPIDLWLSRALRRSKILVLLGEPVAFTRPWVRWEVETFASGKPDAQLIMISFGNAFQDNQQPENFFQPYAVASF
jgi:hypothetical protein